MNNEPENPPAFPQSPIILPSGAVEHPGSYFVDIGGMTLRDYFAAKVIAECLRNTARAVDEGESHLDAADIPNQSAIDAYTVADAMLRARKEKP